MKQLKIPAVFMRGGTSRAIMFHARDLPDRAEWDPIFLAAMGSPDPNGRQLNGRANTIDTIATTGIVRPMLASADPSARLKLVCRRLASAARTAA